MQFKNDIEQELRQLSDLGLHMFIDILVKAEDAEGNTLEPAIPASVREKRKKGSFVNEYQNWYTQAL